MARRKRNRKPGWRPPELTEAQILAWCDAFHSHTGLWPTKRLGRLVIERSGGERWSAVIAALSTGGRGLPGGSSLARLLAKHRGVRNRKGLPRLTHEKILTWADAWRERTGEWPTQRISPGAIPNSVGEKWQTVDDALRRGARSLPGLSSLAKLLADRRGVRNFADLPQLTEDQILKWCDEFRKRVGRWPRQRDWYEPIPNSGGENWLGVDQALKLGLRGLSGKKTLAELMAERRGVRNQAKLPRLTYAQIFEWAKAYRSLTGSWPACRCLPNEIEGSNGETWRNIDQVLRKGMRGLPGESSLSRLIARNDRGMRAASRRKER